MIEIQSNTMDPGLSYPIVNLIEVIIDEVALEGLDGITLEGDSFQFLS